MPPKSSTRLTIETGLVAWRRLEGIEARLEKAAQKTLAALPQKFQPIAKRAEATLLLTSDKAVQSLNRDWRGKNKPTNVLSFPQFSPKILTALGAGKERVSVGDMAIAWPFVQKEAKAQGKTVEDHVTHLVVHSLLHLFGYDHREDREAASMEKLEVSILKSLKIADPYAVEETK